MPNVPRFVLQVMVSCRSLYCLVLLHLAACAVASLQPQLEPPEESDSDLTSGDMPLKRAPLRFGKRAPLRFGKREPSGVEEGTARRLRAAPMRFGKRYFWDSQFFTKKSPMRFGKRAPLRFGKRSGEEEEEEEMDKRAPAPMRFGKREYEVEDDIAADTEKRAAPMRFGKRAAPLRFGKRGAPLRFGKRSPQYELEDLHQAGG